MAWSQNPNRRIFSLICGLLICVGVSGNAMGEPTASAVSAFNAYVAKVESRLAQQHQSKTAFLAPEASAQQNEIHLHRGEFAVEQLTPDTGTVLSGALLHHWRGTTFVAGAKAADFERLLKNFNAYPEHFSPEVLQAKVLAQNGDHFHVLIRVRQHHVITVVMDTTYDVSFQQLDAQRGYSISKSIRISEIDNSGSINERVLNSNEEHGFLWRLNTYWSYEERDGGLYIQIESISLTRSIPTGLGWVVRPFVESVPRESMAFTLRSTCNALQNNLKPQIAGENPQQLERISK